VCNREHALRDIGVFEGGWMVQNIMPTKDDEEDFHVDVQIGALQRMFSA